MRIETLHIQNFRGFQDITLNFPRNNLAVFIGINGAGKSTILDCIAIMLARFVAKLRNREVADIELSEDDIRLNYDSNINTITISVEDEGGQGLPKHLQHCDTKKGNAVLTINPLDNIKNCENLIKYHLNGEIYSDDITINEELNKILNLNVQTLKQNRKRVLDVLIQTLISERPKGDWTAAMLNNKIKEWSNKQEDNKYKAYCQIVIYYLKKKLSKLK